MSALITVGKALNNLKVKKLIRNSCQGPNQVCDDLVVLLYAFHLWVVTSCDYYVQGMIRSEMLEETDTFDDDMQKWVS